MLCSGRDPAFLAIAKLYGSGLQNSTKSCDRGTVVRIPPGLQDDTKCRDPLDSCDWNPSREGSTREQQPGIRYCGSLGSGVLPILCQASNLFSFSYSLFILLLLLFGSFLLDVYLLLDELASSDARGFCRHKVRYKLGMRMN